MKTHVGNADGDWNDHAFARRIHEQSKEQWIREQRRVEEMHGTCVSVELDETEYLRRLKAVMERERIRELLR